MSNETCFATSSYLPREGNDVNIGLLRSRKINKCNISDRAKYAWQVMRSIIFKNKFISKINFSKLVFVGSFTIGEEQSSVLS